MTDTDFKFICFDNLSTMPSNEFYNLHYEINSYEFLKNVDEIESRYRINIQKKKIINTMIHLQNYINIFYNDIQDIRQFINCNLNYQYI